MSAPKILPDRHFRFLSSLRTPESVDMFLKTQHDTPNELETYQHYPYQVCGCNAAGSLRESLKGKKMSEMTSIPTGVLTAEEFIGAYTDPIQIRDAYNSLFCPVSEETPIPLRERLLSSTAEEIGERKFFLEKLMSLVKVQYRFLVDIETEKLEALSNDERIRVRKIDQERRWSVKSPNDPAPRAKASGISTETVNKIKASIDDDLADLLAKK